MKIGPVAMVIIGLALAGAFASWVVAAIFAVRALTSIEGPDRSRMRWFAMVAWPFAVQRLRGQAAAHAAVVNKAIVAFIVCVTLAVVTISVATNLSRYS